MKKILSLFAVGFSLMATTAMAQVNVGGLPWSLSSHANDITNAPESVTTARPDYEAAKLGDANPEIGPYRIGIRMPVRYNFKDFGTISHLANGKKIWRLQIVVPDALGIDAYMEHFYLPQGVTMYFYNANRRQVDGGYDAKSNNDIQVFASPKIEGSAMTIELDIENGVDVNQINFDIHMLVANYRGGMVQDLQKTYGAPADVPLYSLADLCTVNAICDVAAPYYPNAGKAAVHIDEGGYVCSGNMVGNTANDCTPIMLTASHCEETNSVSNTTFNVWKFYFNYEAATCNEKATENMIKTQYTTGATFLARSIENDRPRLIGDFLLLKLRDLGNVIRSEYGATYSGWDRMTGPPLGVSYINFSHPGGDGKKFAKFSRIYGNGNFNGGMASSHWSCRLALGGIQGGSSGSGLMREDNQRLIGDLSGGPSSFGACDTADGNRSLFSKFTLNWDYASGDGSNAQKLSPWLDPVGSNPQYINSVRYVDGSCAAMDGTTAIDAKDKLSAAITVYPNPSKGVVTIKTGFTSNQKVSFEVVNVVGKTVAVFPAAKINNGESQLDLSNLPKGIYLLKASDGTATVGKKIVLN